MWVCVCVCVVFNRLVDKIPYYLLDCLMESHPLLISNIRFEYFKEKLSGDHIYEEFSTDFESIVFRTENWKLIFHRSLLKIALANFFFTHIVHFSAKTMFATKTLSTENNGQIINWLNQKVREKFFMLLYAIEFVFFLFSLLCNQSKSQIMFIFDRSKLEICYRCDLIYFPYIATSNLRSVTVCLLSNFATNETNLFGFLLAFDYLVSLAQWKEKTSFFSSSSTWWHCLSKYKQIDTNQEERTLIKFPFDTYSESLGLVQMENSATTNYGHRNRHHCRS